jgi:4-hydroxy-tetrahydrodipicolinate synthase
MSRSYEAMDAKAWAKDALTGYVAVSFTPYRADGGIDHDAVAADVEYTLSLPHIGGLYVGSIYQEFWLLSVRERMALAQTVISAAAGRVPVIVAASHTVAEEAIALARHAADAGADLVMLWPPYFGPRDHEGILAFYHQVMAGADIGFAFYNTGLAEVGYQMSAEVLDRLADHPKICVLKEASLREDVYLDTIANIGDRVQVSSPLEEYWLSGRALMPDLAPKFLMGSSRALIMQTPSDPLLGRFYEHAMAGSFEAAAAELRVILQLSEQLHGPSLRSGHHPVGLIKAIRGGLGQSGGNPRPPCHAPSQAEVAAALAILDKFRNPA